MKKTKNVGGRPTVISNECVSKLHEAFKSGLNVKDSCIYAGISREAFYSNLHKNRGFSDKIRASQAFIKMVAKQIVAKAICVDGSIADAWRFLEKYDPDYSNRPRVKYKR